MFFCSFKYSVFGEHWLQEALPFISNGKQYILYGHRHDQSILSILRIRHKLPTVLKAWEFYEFRSLEHTQKIIVFFIIIMVLLNIFSCRNTLLNDVFHVLHFSILLIP